MNTPSYIRIFSVLGDGKWHNCSEWCRPLSEDKRRLREMEERGWINYEVRIVRGMGGGVAYTEYRITSVDWNKWGDYYRQYRLTKVNPETKQVELVI